MMASVALNMKTNISGVVALVLWFLFWASNAFAVLRPPYPQKTDPPDHIIMIVDGGVNHIVGTANKPKVPRNSELK
jgi:hypothetical protein